MDATDMTAPVTRGELREELALFRQDVHEQISALDQRHGAILEKQGARLEEINERLANHDDRFAQLGNGLARNNELLAKHEERFARLEAALAKHDECFAEDRRTFEFWTGAILARIEDSAKATEQRLGAELARHTSAILEAMQVQISVIDEKYTDLPGRVRRLESTVFPRDER